jgi:hypothetical protein
MVFNASLAININAMTLAYVNKSVTVIIKEILGGLGEK